MVVILLVIPLCENLEGTCLSLLAGLIPHWLYFRMAGNWHGFPYVYIITNL